jgi:hypothetical protein
MVLVFFTTVFFGALMPKMVTYFKKNEIGEIEMTKTREINNTKLGFSINDSETHFEKYSIHNYDSNDESKHDNVNVVDLNVSQKLSKKITGLWRRLDNFVMKPFFIDDWPYVKEDHDQISQKIISVFDEHQKKKIKNKELANIMGSDPKKEEKIESLLIDRNERKRKFSNSKSLNQKN